MQSHTIYTGAIFKMQALLKSSEKYFFVTLNAEPGDFYQRKLEKSQWQFVFEISFDFGEAPAQ